MRLKKKIKSVVSLTLLLSFLFSVTAFANGGSVNFSWDRRVLDGSVSKKFYTLTPGQVHLDSACIIDGGDNPLSSCTYYVQLYLSKIGTDPNYGSVAQSASRNTYLSNSAYWNVDVSSSNYYLYFWKTDDYLLINGSGTLYDY